MNFGTLIPAVAAGLLVFALVYRPLPGVDKTKAFLLGLVTRPTIPWIPLWGAAFILFTWGGRPVEVVPWVYGAFWIGQHLSSYLEFFSADRRPYHGRVHSVLLGLGVTLVILFGWPPAEISPESVVAMAGVGQKIVQRTVVPTLEQRLQTKLAMARLQAKKKDIVSRDDNTAAIKELTASNQRVIESNEAVLRSKSSTVEEVVAELKPFLSGSAFGNVCGAVSVALGLYSVAGPEIKAGLPEAVLQVKPPGANPFGETPLTPPRLRKNLFLLGLLVFPQGPNLALPMGIAFFLYLAVGGIFYWWGTVDSSFLSRFLPPCLNVSEVQKELSRYHGLLRFCRAHGVGFFAAQLGVVFWWTFFHQPPSFLCGPALKVRKVFTESGWLLQEKMVYLSGGPPEGRELFFRIQLLRDRGNDLGERMFLFWNQVGSDQTFHAEPTRWWGIYPGWIFLAGGLVLLFLGRTFKGRLVLVVPLFPPTPVVVHLLSGAAMVLVASFVGWRWWRASISWSEFVGQEIYPTGMSPAAAAALVRRASWWCGFQTLTGTFGFLGTVYFLGECFDSVYFSETNAEVIAAQLDEAKGWLAELDGRPGWVQLEAEARHHVIQLQLVEADWIEVTTGGEHWLWVRRVVRFALTAAAAGSLWWGGRRFR